MSLQTPDKIQAVQRQPYRKAKRERNFLFRDNALRMGPGLMRRPAGARRKRKASTLRR